MADEQHPRRATVGYEFIDPEKTRMAPTLKAAWVIAAGLVVGGFIAGVTYTDLKHEVRGLRERFDGVSSRAEVQILDAKWNNLIDVKIKERTQRFLVRCPRNALRGSGDVAECPAVPVP